MLRSSPDRSAAHVRRTAKRTTWLICGVAMGLLSARALHAHDDGTPHSHDAPATGPAQKTTPSAEELFAEKLHGSDWPELSEAQSQQLMARGMSVAVIAATHLNEMKQDKSTELLRLISQLARSRRTQPELLRLYDPIAYLTFYGPDARAKQQQFAVPLMWRKWPSQTVYTMVRVAPLPLLAYLQTQADAKMPDSDHLEEVFREWGWWVRTGNEIQHVKELNEIIPRLFKNATITTDEKLLAALVRFTGEAHATAAVPLLLPCLSHNSETVRAGTAAALLRILRVLPAADRSAVRDAVVDRLNNETGTEAQTALAATAEILGAEESVGDALLDLSSRAKSPAVRRAILFSAAHAQWSKRDKLILAGLADPDPGTIAVALQAVAAHPTPAALPSVLELLDSIKSAQSPLIDAAGALADPRAVPTLKRWLADTNPAIRLKIALALEKIAAAESAAKKSSTAATLLLSELNHEASSMVVPHLIAAAARLRLPDAEPTLIALAVDSTAPLVVRTQAVWALGKFDSPAVRKTLQDLQDDTKKYFGDAFDPALPAGSPERIEQARLFVALSRMQLGVPGAKQEAEAICRRGNPTTQLTMLMVLAELQLDHPAVRQGLNSSEFAILLAAIKAAEAIDPQKYYADLLALQRAPFIAPLGASGLNTMGLNAILQSAIDAGQEDKK